ncbi:hypothetical protein EJB05_18952 [Eragrostis curvula]|uniref:Uncharacterized protein n=1 Tax=Eragrostis curvula TaxID=38414 RepID=A0A5J9VPK6_9POAL|nr:hypothetical protein EJB05_18952 [Eragrostis curvula]
MLRRRSGRSLQIQIECAGGLHAYQLLDGMTQWANILKTKLFSMLADEVLLLLWLQLNESKSFEMSPKYDHVLMKERTHDLNGCDGDMFGSELHLQSICMDLQGLYSELFYWYILTEACLLPSIEVQMGHLKKTWSSSVRRLIQRQLQTKSEVSQ